MASESTEKSPPPSTVKPEDAPSLEEVLAIEPSEERMARLAEIIELDLPNVSEEVRRHIFRDDVRVLSILYNQILAGVKLDENIVDGLMVNAVDTHVHGASDPFERLMPEDLIARDFTDAAFRAIVIKTWFTPSASRNQIVQRLTDEYAEAHSLRAVRVLGGVTLNYSVGGINPDVVRKCLGFPGMKYVWVPMVDSYHHRRVVYDDWSGFGLKFTDDKFNIVSEMKEILRIIADNDLVLAVGHYGYEDAAALIEEARRLGVEHIELVHPQLIHSGRHSISQMNDQIERGAKIMIMTKGLVAWPPYNNPFFIVRAIRQLGAQNFVLGSDFGQVQHIPSLVGDRWGIKSLLANGVSVEDMRTILQDSPREHLGLEPVESEGVPQIRRAGFGTPHYPGHQHSGETGTSERCC